MKKARFMSLLKNVKWKDQPSLYKLNGYGRIYITIQIETSSVFPAYPEIHRVRTQYDRASEIKFRTLWKRYNSWLNQWYIRNSPGNHLSSENEFKTQLRAAGFNESVISKEWNRQKGDGT